MSEIASSTVESDNQADEQWGDQLTAKVAGNADKLVICPWLGGEEVTLEHAMLTFDWPPNLTAKDEPYLISVVETLLASRAAVGKNPKEPIVKQVLPETKEKPEEVLEVEPEQEEKVKDVVVEPLRLHESAKAVQVKKTETTAVHSQKPTRPSVEAQATSAKEKMAEEEDDRLGLEVFRSYIRKRYKADCDITRQPGTFIVKAPSYELAAMIHLERQKLKKAIGLREAIVVRSSRDFLVPTPLSAA